MFATIVDSRGNVVFVGFCSLSKDALLDGERAELARLMQEIDRVVMGAVRRRDSLDAAGKIDLTLTGEVDLRREIQKRINRDA